MRKFENISDFWLKSRLFKKCVPYLLLDSYFFWVVLHMFKETYVFRWFLAFGKAVLKKAKISNSRNSNLPPQILIDWVKSILEMQKSLKNIDILIFLWAIKVLLNNTPMWNEAKEKIQIFFKIFILNYLYFSYILILY